MVHFFFFTEQEDIKKEDLSYFKLDKLITHKKFISK